MSKDAPTFGIDVHPAYQAGLNFGRVADTGYDFVVVKASQGARYSPPELASYFAGLKRAGLVNGLYHFLDATASAVAQADNFMRRVNALGGADGLLLAVDFEHYGALSPSNALLKGFISEVKRRTGGHPVVIYTAKSFWDGGDSSGSFAQYGADALWSARYADLDRHNEPKAHYQGIKNWGWDAIGGRASDIWQFTSSGLVAGQYIDVNASLIGKDGLAKLTRKGAGKPKPESGNGGDVDADRVVIFDKRTGKVAGFTSTPTARRVAQEIRRKVKMDADKTVEVRKAGDEHRVVIPQVFTSHETAQRVAGEIRRKVEMDENKGVRVLDTGRVVPVKTPMNGGGNVARGKAPTARDFWNFVDWLRPAIGGNRTPYWIWKDGIVPDGPGAYATNRAVPSIEFVKGEPGIFCAGVPNLHMRWIGKRIPTKGDPTLDGGIAAYFHGRFGNGYYSGFDEPFDMAKAKKWADDTNHPVMIGRGYWGPNLGDQGHVAYLLPRHTDGKYYVLQSFGPKWPGLNWAFTIEESHQGGYYKVMVHPRDFALYEGDEF